MSLERARRGLVVREVSLARMRMRMPRKQAATALALALLALLAAWHTAAAAPGLQQNRCV